MRDPLALRLDFGSPRGMDLGRALISDLRDARVRLLALVEDLSDEDLRVPRLSILNPPLWEIGHVAWFQEKWTLRHLARRASIREDTDLLFDSAAIAHDTRWELALGSRERTLRYMADVLDAVEARLARREADPDDAYFHRLATLHEDMHAEALLYTRQTLGYSFPRSWPARATPAASAGPLPGDVEVPGGVFELGAARGLPFVFDNEKWAHPVHVAPFRIARAPVTQGEFAEFVEAGGYERDEWWDEAGLQWRTASAARLPVYWRRESGGGFSRRHFDRVVPLARHQPMLHVNAFEAEAFCRFAGRRLPTEAEWELAASGASVTSSAALSKRLFPWGDEPPRDEQAHLDLRAPDCADVAAYPAGDSAFGCRQMIGNVWEWTASVFAPYPGFVADPYAEYSAPWFGTHRVLRGGCFATRARLVRATWRNFYTPDRRDVFAGFRTCAR